MGNRNDRHYEYDMQQIIEIKNLAAGYNGRAVIEDVNLSLYDRDFLGIIGPNGGGKTTLLKVLIGLEKPISGTVTQAKDLKIGYLPQYNATDKLFPITVRDTVMMGLNSELGLWGRVNEKQKATVKATLERFHLTGLAGRPLKALSGGQLQRVLMARAIVSSPDVIVLDEPHTYIDKQFEDEFNKILDEERRRCAIVMVSHNVEYMRKTASKLIHVDKTVSLLS